MPLAKLVLTPLLMMRNLLANMYAEDKDAVEKLKVSKGSSFAAVMYSAKLARKHLTECCNAVPDSVALEWAITGQKPDNLEEKIKQTLTSKTPYLQSALSEIDDKLIRECVANSYRKSIINKKLTYDYKNIRSKFLKSRIRVLTRILYLNEIE